MAETDYFDEEIDPIQDVEYSTWKQLFRYFAPYRRQLTLLAVTAIITGLLEPLYALITKWLLDDITANGADASFWLWGSAYFGMSVGLAVVVTGFILMTNQLRVQASYDLRKAAFQNLQRQSFAYFDRRPVGWLVARLTSDCERLTNILAWATLDLIWCLTMMIAVSFALFWLNWTLTLIMLSIMPLVAWVSLKFRGSILGSARRVRSTNSQITATFNESIMGVETSKAFVLEDANSKRFGRQTKTMYLASVKNLTLAAIYVPIIVSASSLSYGITLAYGGSELLAGTMAVTSLISFMMLVTFFFEPFEVVGHWFAEMQMAQASAERLLSIIDAKPDIEDSVSVQEALNLNKDTELTSKRAIDGGSNSIDHIELSRVGFEYENGIPVLQDVDLSVSKGESIALVGPTGGGKTTLVNVICRFYEPTRGSVLIDGIDYRNRSQHWLQSNLGIVLQQAHVFSGSVMENIRYGNLDATDEEVIQAAKLVEAHEFIQELENGYSTEVGEGGGKLSAGQKQLISFARAILADPQILVLDEATSSVDTETERRIQKGVARMLSGRISFVIAHRLSTIRHADKILYIHDGRIVEAGTHAELLKRRGKYFELYRQQSLDQSFDEALEHELLSNSQSARNNTQAT